MSYNLLKGKRGIIFGALDENSIAWKTAERVHQEGGTFVLIDFGPRWLDLVPYGRIWFQKWSTKVKTNVFPEMIRKGLEMVPIASGGPGNRFLYYNNVFFIFKKRTVFSFWVSIP